jgi:hypothetical protein
MTSTAVQWRLSGVSDGNRIRLIVSAIPFHGRQMTQFELQITRITDAAFVCYRRKSNCMSWISCLINWSRVSAAL